MEEKLLVQYNKVEVCRKELIVLKEVDFKLYAGEFVYFIGRVGTGKSSLLKTMYADIPILEGEASVLGYNMKMLKDRSVNENLEFVLKATGWKDKADIAERVEQVLVQVGMQKKAYKMPHELSGGEQQRIVIARALLNSPQIILADEPTGNLDPQTGQQIVSLLHSICQTGTAVIMTTHNHHLVDEFPGRILKCENKKLVEVNNTKD